MTKKQSLSTLQEQFRLVKGIWLPDLKKIFQEKPYEFDRLCIPTLWLHCENIALYRLFVESDVAATKQAFYTCGKLTNYVVLKFGFQDKKVDAKLDHPSILVDAMGFVSHFSYILLSDSPELIDQYSTLRHQWWEEKLRSGGVVLAAAVQCVLRNDWDGLASLLPHFKTNRSQFDKEFFIGMIEKNVDKVNQSIETLCSKKLNRHNPFLANLISSPAAGYTKLAWLKGMQVEIDSPLVPMELMPIAPLENYVNPYERFWRLGEE